MWYDPRALKAGQNGKGASLGLVDIVPNKNLTAQLFEQHGEPLVRYLTARFGDAEEAKEIAQEAWVRIHRLERPESLDNPRAFLFQTASNVAIDRLRRERVETRVRAESSPQQVADSNLEAGLEVERQLEVIEKALEELPFKCRQAFLLHRTFGRTYAQIADELEVSVSMVEKYIIQALKHFRNKLRD